MPLIVLATVISGAYAALRANIKHEDLTGAVLGTAFLLGLFNLPYFGAPTSAGGPQLFPLNDTVGDNGRRSQPKVAPNEA